MLKYWNRLLRTIATAFPATMRSHKACQAIDRPTPVIEAMFHMPRPLSSYKSLPLSIAIRRWILEIQCLRLHPFHLYTAMFSNRACNNNTKTTPNQCNPTKHLNSTALPNHHPNRRVSTYNKIPQTSQQIMPFRHTTSSTLL